MLALALLLSYAAAASASQGVEPPDMRLEQNQGFCSPGAYPTTIAAPDQPSGMKTWGSYCAEGDHTTGSAETSPFTAPPYIRLYLAGYLPEPGLRLDLENVANGSRIPIVPGFVAHERWVRFDVPVPAAWRGQMVRLVATDIAQKPGGWFAFSEPFAGSSLIGGFGEAVPLAMRTLYYFVLTVLPCLALGTLAIRKGLRDVVLVGLLELAALGLCGYLAFWLWFIAPRLGHLFSFLLPIVSLAFLGWNYGRLDIGGRLIVRRLLTPLLLIGGASLMILCAGFFYGGFDDPFRTAAERYSHPLPPDNTIPYLFAEAVRNGRVPKPLQADWLSSDRPPLQTGSVLLLYPYMAKPREIGYTVEAVLLQSLWIFAAWLLLTAFGVDARAVALVLGVCLFSGFVFLNSFYVWPKLLAGAFTLGLLALLFTRKAAVLRNSRFTCALAGALLALSLLAHGGSVFAVIGLVLTMLLLRRAMPLRTVAVLIATAVFLYMPWLLYQKFYDPPANRLLKMHLAGIIEVDKRSFSEALIESYRALTPRQILSNKLVNLEALIENAGPFWVATKELLQSGDPIESASIAGAMRGWFFFLFTPNLGFLMLGPLALLWGLVKRHRTIEWRTAAILWLFIVLTAIPWALLMFRPGMTLIHQGTYAMVLAGYAGSLLAFWAISRFLAIAVGCLQITLNVLLYAVFMHSAPANALPAQRPASEGCLWFGAAGLLFVLGLLASLYAAGGKFNRTRVQEKFAVAFGAGDGTVH
jgi:hypothetical protein